MLSTLSTSYEACKQQLSHFRIQQIQIMQWDDVWLHYRLYAADDNGHRKLTRCHYSRSHTLRVQIRQQRGSGRILLLQCLNTLSFSQVLTLVIQQSMLHNTSSCTFWNSQAAGRGQVSTESNEHGVRVQKQTAQAEFNNIKLNTSYGHEVFSQPNCTCMFKYLKYFTCVLTLVSGVPRGTQLRH